jgi:hypothetical protein
MFCSLKSAPIGLRFMGTATVSAVSSVSAPMVDEEFALEGNRKRGTSGKQNVQTYSFVFTGPCLSVAGGIAVFVLLEARSRSS